VWQEISRAANHLRALEILKEQGKEDDYSAADYVRAVEKAAT
jgi:hypothetical protein